MKISFNIGLEDNMAFQEFFYRTNPKFKKQVRAAQLGLPLFLIVLVLLSCWNGSCDWPSFILFAASAVAWIVFFPRWNKRSYLRRVRRIIDSPQNDNWYGERTYELDEENVSIISKNQTDIISWKAFVRAEETESYFFLFTTALQAQIIPKRQITETEVGELRSLFARHIAVKTSDIENKKI